VQHCSVGRARVPAGGVMVIPIGKLGFAARDY